MLEILVLILAMFLGVWWGGFENRAWREHGEAWILNHFKSYHVFMAVLFTAINAIAAMFIFSLEPKGLGLWVWLMVWDTVTLDVVWWFIRGYDYYCDYTKAVASYGGELNGKPERPDWDNCPIYIIRLNPLRVESWKPPLLWGCYWWWWACYFVLVVLGALIVFV